MRKTVIVGSRESQLAQTQTALIIAELQKQYPAIAFKVKTIKTAGDKILDAPLAKLGDKGLFVKEIEQALLNKEIDFAVHSMKDMPTVLPDGLTIAAITLREDPRDCYLAKDDQTSLYDSPQGAKIGTSSLRRVAQLLGQRPDLQAVPIRGNLHSRLRKLEESDLAGIILAYAGISRLGWTAKITQILSINKFLPAVGQGALGIETRQDDTEFIRMVAALNDPLTEVAVTAERAFLRKLEGGCQVPIGAWGRVVKEELLLDGMVASLRGETVLREQVRGRLSQAEELGKQLADILLAQGAATLLEQVRQEYQAHD